LKILGAILILIATTWVGFEFAKRLTERPRQLRHLKVALQSLESEIMYGLTPLADACDHIAKQLPKPLTYFFTCFSERLKMGEVSVHRAWEDSLKETFNSFV
jgi:stage III sporulation protein AB